MSHMKTRVSVIENDLVHGNGAFNRLESAITDLADVIKAHIERDESRAMKVGVALVGFLGASVISLVAYIWVLQVGGYG